MAYLTVQNLSAGYESKAVVKDVYFSVNAGDYLCVVGENGSGKSILVKTMLRLQEPI